MLPNPMDYLKKLTSVFLCSLGTGALLCSCDRVSPDEYTRILVENRLHLQDVLMKTEISFQDSDMEDKEVFQRIGADDFPWPATLVLDGEPTTSGEEVHFSFHYERGFRFQQPTSADEEKVCFEEADVGIVKLQIAVEPGGDFNEEKISVSNDVKDWKQLETWLLKHSTTSSGKAELKQFNYLLPLIESVVTTEENTEAHPGGPGPWLMMLEPEKLTVTVADGEGSNTGQRQPRVWTVALCSPPSKAVVDLRSGKPILTDLNPR